MNKKNQEGSLPFTNCFSVFSMTCISFLSVQTVVGLLSNPVLCGRMQGRRPQLSKLQTHHREVQPDVSPNGYTGSNNKRPPGKKFFHLLNLNWYFGFNCVDLINWWIIFFVVEIYDKQRLICAINNISLK